MSASLKPDGRRSGQETQRGLGTCRHPLVDGRVRAGPFRSSKESSGHSVPPASSFGLYQGCPGLSPSPSCPFELPIRVHTLLPEKRQTSALERKCQKVPGVASLRRAP